MSKNVAGGEPGASSGAALSGCGGFPVLRTSLIPIVLAFSASAVHAQESIRWLSDPQQAVETSKKTGRPIMAYVLAGTRDRDDDIERDQKRAAADPRVVKLAQRFVCLRLSRSAHRDVLGQFGLQPSANMMISFVAPDGKKIDDLSAAGMTKADSWAQKMSLVLKAYGAKLYQEEVRPVLEKDDAKPAELKEAFNTIREYQIADADAGLIKMLERENLKPEVQKDVLDLLALLSTREGTKKLVDLAVAGDAKAAKALENCEPPAAEVMVEVLRSDDAKFPYAVYQAIGKVCKIGSLKPETFFEKSPARQRDEEIARVREQVRKAADKWRKQNDSAR